MDMPVHEELRRQFDLVGLRREAGELRTTRQLNEAQDIRERSDRARAKEETLYVERYRTRIEQSARRLIHEAGSWSRDLTPEWAGQDRFAPDAILRQAEREVRHAHERRLQRIVDWERGTLGDLIEKSARENSIHGKAREDFSQAVDRRSGTERRGGWVRSR